MNTFEGIQSLDFPTPLPDSLLVVEQHFDAPKLANVVASTANALDESGLLTRLAPNAIVAVGVGSRGIANLAVVVKTVIEQLRSAGMRPFVFPAMGSHGGATPEGQVSVLSEMGVTPEGVGAEIRATMAVTQIGKIPDGPPLFQDANAAAADHTLLINRVKPHTDFRSSIESGLAKMAVIGQGKQHGAAEMHSWGTAGFQRFLAPAARIYAGDTNLVGGLAILENARDETAKIVGLLAEDIGGPLEARLLEEAKALMADLPFPQIDVLLIRRLGKDISGTGIDTNIVGRVMIPRQPEDFGGPDVAMIAVLDLTEGTHGNANGLGLADVTTSRVARKIDWTATYLNGITAGIFGVQRVRLPIVMSNDLRALQVAVRGCGQQYTAARIVLIRDTLTLDRLWVSPNLRSVVDSHPRLSVVGAVPLDFDKDGVLMSPWNMD